MSGGGRSNGSNVHQWSNPDSPETQWRFSKVEAKEAKLVMKLVMNATYTIESVNAPGQFLNISGGGMNNGTNVQLWNNPSMSHTQWVLEGKDAGHVAIRNVHSGRCCVVLCCVVLCCDVLVRVCACMGGRCAVNASCDVHTRPICLCRQVSECGWWV